MVSETRTRIELHTLAGKFLGNLEADAKATVHTLKNMIAASWQLPPECQELVHGTCVLHDRDYVPRSECANGALVITVVISLEKVYRRLEDPNPKARQKALQAMASSAEKGDGRALGAVALRLADPSALVRGAAVKALGCVALRGDVRALEEASLRLENVDAGVRRVAVEAIAQVARKGDSQAISALARCLSDPSALVRAAAVEAFAQVVEKGDQCAIDAVQTHMANPDVEIHQAATEVLSFLLQYQQFDLDASKWHLACPVGHTDDDPGHHPPAEGGGLQDARLRCPRGHALHQFTVIDTGVEDSDGFECDGCDAPQLHGEVIFGCRACDYDLCSSCAERARSGDNS